ncbi:MAG: acetyl-CoA hydrolase/transferase family protein [Desulfosporosinus sp.]
MKKVLELYKEKVRPADEAIKLIQDGDYIAVSIGETPTLLEALSEHYKEYHDVKVCQIFAHREYSYLDLEKIDHVRHLSYFVGAQSRKGAQEGWIDFIPSYFSQMPNMFRQGYLRADVVFALASTMDEHGYFSVSLGPDYTMGAMEKARNIILEVNPNVPFAYGNNLVHISQLSAVVEDDRPVYSVGLPEIGPAEKVIGQYIADMIEDGSTVQIGFGAIADAVAMQLTNKHDLGVHTEMVGDAILGLYECGAVTNKKKNYLPGRAVATFALGSEKLYKWMHRNPEIEMHPVDYTNDPYLAGLNDNLITINGSIQIDFLGQCCSESIGHRPYSGTGGQLDFVRAGNRSKGGKSILCFPSTAKNGQLSRIVPVLAPGSHVTTHKNDVNYIVTEYGVAQLYGKSAKQRAEELIAIAHPDFRGELRKEAKRMLLL